MVPQLVLPVRLGKHLLLVVKQELDGLVLQISRFVNVRQHKDVNDLESRV